MIFSVVCYQVSLGGYQTIWVGPCLYICRGSQQALLIESIYNHQDHPAERTSADMEFRNYPKPKHLSSQLPNRNRYFSSDKAWKNNYGMQLFKFFQPCRKYIKTAKTGGFCEELLSENDFEVVLVNFCCYEYIMVPMLLRQFRRED